MRKRNLIADAFFEGVSAFSEESGANGFDSRAEYSGIKNDGDLTRMICTASYTDYDIEYVYTASGAGLCSVFNFRVIFDRRTPYIKYSPYDLMFKIDENDFRTFTFGYIESPERMKRIIEALVPRLYGFLDGLDRIVRSRAVMSDVFDKFSDGVNAHFGREIFRAAESDDGGLADMLESYYTADDSFYVSKAYALFLRCDYNSAYNAMRRYKNRSGYKVRLMTFIASIQKEYEAVPPECDSTGDGVFAAKTQLGRFMLSGAIMFLPVAAVLAGLHFLVSALIYNGAIWSDAWFWLHALRYVSSALIPALAYGYFARKATLIFFKPERRKYLSALDKITANRRQSGCFSVTVYAVTAMLLISVVINANTFAAFYDRNLRLPSETSLIQSDRYDYNEVEKLVKAEGQYDRYGNYLPVEQYIIVLKNGKKYMLSYEITNDIAEKKIVPVFESKGVPVVTVKDADDLDFVP